MKLLDHYSEFRRTFHTCEHCGWSGTGAMMKNGTGLGINERCPKCGERHSFPKSSAIADDHAPDDRRPVVR